MGITFIPEERLFKLDTPNTTYCICIVDQEGFLGHAYYGRRLEAVQGISALMRIYENPMTPQVNARDRLSFLDSFPTEYPPTVWETTARAVFGCGARRDTAPCC